MMARYPKAEWRPLGPQQEPLLVKKNKIILHTMVGTLLGTDAFFREEGYDGTESHFGVGGDGTSFQWQGTKHQADAQLEGNDDGISIETADMGPEFPNWSGSNVPAWTADQMAALVDLVAWLCKTHDIPAVLIANTFDATKGIGYHRQGIDPFRTRGEHYSESFGKVCPGDRRVAQMDELVRRVQRKLEEEKPLTPEDKEWVETRAREIAQHEARQASRNVAVRIANAILRMFTSEDKPSAVDSGTR